MFNVYHIYIVESNMLTYLVYIQSCNVTGIIPKWLIELNKHQIVILLQKSILQYLCSVEVDWQICKDTGEHAWGWRSGVLCKQFGVSQLSICLYSKYYNRVFVSALLCKNQSQMARRVI